MISSILLALVSSAAFQLTSSLPVIVQNSTIPANVTEYIIDLAQNGTILTNFTLHSNSLNGTFTNGTICAPVYEPISQSYSSYHWALVNLTTLSSNASYAVNKSDYLFPHNFTFTANISCNVLNGTIANVTVQNKQNFTQFRINSAIPATSTIDDFYSQPEIQSYSDDQNPISTQVYAPPSSPTTTTSSKYVPIVASSTTPLAIKTTSSTPVTTSSTTNYQPAVNNAVIQPTSIVTTSTSVKTTTSYSAPAVASPVKAVVTTSAADTSSNSAEQFSGPATFYATGLGACGWVNSDSDFIAAAAKGMFDSFPNGGNTNNSPICGKKAIVTGPAGAKITVSIVDRCDGCDDTNALDFSPSAFQALVAGAYVNSNTGLGIGRVPAVKWQWA